MTEPVIRRERRPPKDEEPLPPVSGERHRLVLAAYHASRLALSRVRDGLRYADEWHRDWSEVGFAMNALDRGIEETDLRHYTGGELAESGAVSIAQGRFDSVPSTTGAAP